MDFCGGLISGWCGLNTLLLRIDDLRAPCWIHLVLRGCWILVGCNYWPPRHDLGGFLSLIDCP